MLSNLELMELEKSIFKIIHEMIETHLGKYWDKYTAIKCL